MANKGILNSIKEIIGENHKNDYVLNPYNHVSLYEKAAPELTTILKSTDIRAVSNEYQRWDKQAGEHQNEFKKWSRYANSAIFLTACFTAGLIGSGVLVTFPSLNDKMLKLIIGICSGSSIVFSISASICIRRIHSENLLRKWMQNRAEAETLRLHYFDLITTNKSKIDKKNRNSATLFKLEYFRRYQLDVQLTYYEIRSQEHKLASRKAQTMSLIAMGVVTLINGLAGVLGILDERLVILSVMALISQAFASKIGFTEAIDQDTRNSERYERTWSILTKLSSKLDTIREGILQGKHEILNTFVESVHEQLSLEHRQWLDEFEKRSDAIGRLEKQLESLKEA